MLEQFKMKSKKAFSVRATDEDKTIAFEFLFKKKYIVKNSPQSILDGMFSYIKDEAGRQKKKEG